MWTPRCRHTGVNPRPLGSDETVATCRKGLAFGDITRFGPGQQGKEVSVMRGSISLAGQTVMCFDSPVQHAFAFTPSFSLFVECENEEEIKRLASTLGEGGGVLMPLSNYRFSRQFTWITDRYGVSWQLNLR